MNIARSCRNGFTFLELVVVVAIIAILATVVGIKVIPQLGKSKVAAAQAQIVLLEEALGLYHMDTNVYPTSQQGLQALCVKPTTSPVPETYTPGGYMTKGRIPPDPWGREYGYMSPAPDGRPYVIISYGADGEPGGEGENADFSSG